MKAKTEGQGNMGTKNSKLEAAIIKTFSEGGHNVNISQLMGLVQSKWTEFRLHSTPDFRRIIFALEKEGFLKRETTEGITRFTWNRATTKRVNKAGEPTTREVAEAIEKLRDLLFLTYGDDYAFAVMAKGALLASSNKDQGVFHAVVKES